MTSPKQHSPHAVSRAHIVHIAQMPGSGFKGRTHRTNLEVSQTEGTRFIETKGKRSRRKDKTGAQVQDTCSDGAQQHSSLGTGFQDRLSSSDSEESGTNGSKALSLLRCPGRQRWRPVGCTGSSGGSGGSDRMALSLLRCPGRPKRDRAWRAGKGGGSGGSDDWA